MSDDQLNYPGVEIYETKSDGQVVINIIYLKEGAVFNHKVLDSQFSNEIKHTVLYGYSTPLGEFSDLEPLQFIDNLCFRYTGSYLRASRVMKIHHDRLP